MRWWLEDRASHWTSTHHHRVHPRLLERLARSRLLSAHRLRLLLSIHLGCGIPDCIQVYGLLLDVREVILHWRVADLHLLELPRHELLILHLCELLLH